MLTPHQLFAGYLPALNQKVELCKKCARPNKFHPSSILSMAFCGMCTWCAPLFLRLLPTFGDIIGSQQYVPCSPLSGISWILYPIKHEIGDTFLFLDPVTFSSKMNYSSLIYWVTYFQQCKALKHNRSHLNKIVKFWLDYLRRKTGIFCAILPSNTNQS